MREKEQSPVCEHCAYDESMQNGPDSLQPGAVLQGRYLIGRELDRNQFLIYYLGLDIHRKWPVVVKELFPAAIAGREKTSWNVINLEKNGTGYYDFFKQRFLETAGAPNMPICPQGIAQVYGAFEENNTAYVLTEYVEGMNLRNYLKALGRPMTGTEVKQALHLVKNALSDLHRKGLLHWEICPDNVILQPDGTAKLINFGDGEMRFDPKAHEIGAPVGPVVLSNGFAPMELYQMRAKRGPWTDIYGLCATVYWCMTGIKPPAAYERILEDTLDWSRLKYTAPGQLAALQKGMALKPTERFLSVDEFWMRFHSPYVTIPIAAVREQPESPEQDTEKSGGKSWLKKWLKK